jgi:hypothetical protein
MYQRQQNSMFPFNGCPTLPRYAVDRFICEGITAMSNANNLNTKSVEVTSEETTSRRSTIEVRIGKKARSFMIKNDNVVEAKAQMEKAIEGFSEMTSAVESMLENIALYYA